MPQTRCDRISSIVINLLGGLTLGLFLALTLIMMDASNIRTLIAGLEAPRQATLAFVLGTSAIFACGSVLTGTIFARIDRA